MDALFSLYFRRGKPVVSTGWDHFAGGDEAVHKSTTPAAAPYTEALGSTGLLFVQLQKEMASRTGPLSPLGKQVRDSLTGGSAAAGMVLAIAEHDLYVAS